MHTDERWDGMTACDCKTPRCHPEGSTAKSKDLVRQSGKFLTKPYKAPTINSVCSVVLDPITHKDRANGLSTAKALICSWGTTKLK